MEEHRKMIEESKPKDPIYSKIEAFEVAFKLRQYPERYVFFIVDEQDLTAKEPLLFTYLEVNTRLCRMIPQKKWDS